jgi:plastocyanin
VNRVNLLLFVLAVVAVVGVSGCTSQNQTSSMGANGVAIQNMAFNPTTLTVPVGTTVTWKNFDSTTHHIVSDTGVFQSSDLSNGQTFNFTFTKAGNYPYHCSIHPSMTGTIVVTSTGTSTSGTSNQSNQNSSNKSNTSTSSNNSGKVKNITG